MLSAFGPPDKANPISIEMTSVQHKHTMIHQIRIKDCADKEYQSTTIKCLMVFNQSAGNPLNKESLHFVNATPPRLSLSIQLLTKLQAHKRVTHPKNKFSILTFYLEVNTACYKDSFLKLLPGHKMLRSQGE